ncbi:MAG: IS3 family transposase [Candidatus Abyssobacteria bacterium SURF_5]|uniref:IS3 family transposase n=1 Tax=Abyssobacteria bacterium (strain SURF_5) TaxID=2093360 RepID=A0A3A4NGI7_ABYX5|nr:MAG: IS3 family transposase [Candidatus Abyssubacteria bacterium SURF_5]
MVSPSARKAAAKYLRDEEMCSERRACLLMGVSRSAIRYQPQTVEDSRLREEILSLSNQHKRYGYRRVTALLRREGEQVNHKRVHRIWKQEGLGLRRKPRRKRRRGRIAVVIQKAERPNQVWSYDFLEDRTERGGKLRMLAVIDEFTRESLTIRVGKSMDAQRVIDVLLDLFEERGVPEYIRSDNGPEFVSKAVQEWLYLIGCQAIYIEPGSPWENSYIESFIGKFRDECLNMELFRNLREASIVVESWRKEYNELRPHSSLGYQTPVEFAQAVSSSRATPSFRLQPEKEKEEEKAVALTL